MMVLNIFTVKDSKNLIPKIRFLDHFFGILRCRNVNILSSFGRFFEMFLIGMLLIRFAHLKRVRTPKLSGVRTFPESELNVFNYLKTIKNIEKFGLRKKVRTPNSSEYGPGQRGQAVTSITRRLARGAPF